MTIARIFAVALCFLANITITTQSHAQGCLPQWVQDQFCIPGLNGEVYAAAVWDDGTGEALYIGGDFTIAGCDMNAVNIARWTESSWSAISTAENSVVNGPVHALAVYDDGKGPALFVGGQFEFAGGVRVNNTAKWDGIEWLPLEDSFGNGIANCGFAGCTMPVRAMQIFDDGTGEALYIAGEFEYAGGLARKNIAKWNGSEWSSLASNSSQEVNSVIRALEVYDDGSGLALYVAGQFTSVAGLTVNRIARWDGTQWAGLTGPNGTGVSGTVYALQTHDDGTGEALYAAGLVSSAGGYTASRIARWNGTDWSNVPNPSGGQFTGGNGNGLIYSLAEYDDGVETKLIAGGVFTRIDGQTFNRLAMWDGNAWVTIGDPLATPGVSDSDFPTVYVLQNFNTDDGPAIFVGGLFENAGGLHTLNAAYWDGSVIRSLPSPYVSGLNDSVISFATFDDGSGPSLIAGGSFTDAGNSKARRIAKWDGSSWHTLNGPGGASLSSSVYALATHDDGTGSALYAGGNFTLADGFSVNRIARWDGSQWSALTASNGVTGIGNLTVRAIASHDDGSGPALFVAGEFTQAGGVAARHVAKWDGVNWSPLIGPTQSGTDQTALALAVYDDGSGPALYTGGYFDFAGGVGVSHIAKWDGSEWSGLTGSSGTGTNGTVHALAVFDDGTGPALYVAGQFTIAGGLNANSIAKWDGSEWYPLVGTSGNGVTNQVITALSVFDDGSGPALYIGGNFSHAGGINVNHIAKWDGTDWYAIQGPDGVGAGTHSSEIVRALHVHAEGLEPVLAVGGDFFSVGGVASERMALLYPCETDTCIADTNHDGALTPADFTAWIAAFNSQAPECDQNGDGSCSPADFTAWIANYNAGC